MIVRNQTLKKRRKLRQREKFQVYTLNKYTKGFYTKYKSSIIWFILIVIILGIVLIKKCITYLHNTGFININNKPNKIFIIGYSDINSSFIYDIFLSNNISSIQLTPKNIQYNLKYRLQRNELILQDFPNKILFDKIGISPIDNEIYNKSVFDVIHNGYKPWYQILNEQYKDSLFILNTININEWITIRMNNGFNIISKEILLQRFNDKQNINNEFIIKIWKDDWYNFIRNLKEYFKNQKCKLLIYNNSKDNINTLINFIHKCAGIRINVIL